MNIKQENTIALNDEITLYDYWKILVKRKKILLGVFLVPLVIVTMIFLIMPRYYRGEIEISFPTLMVSNKPSAITSPNIFISFPALMVADKPSAITAAKIINFIGYIDDTKKVKMFANNSGAIKSVSISLNKRPTVFDRINIIVDAKTADIIPQSFKDMFNYINNLPEIQEEFTKIQEETDFKIKKLMDAKEANRVFLKDTTDMIKKRKLTVVNFNPADLVKKDEDLELAIIDLQKTKKEMMKEKEINLKVPAGILGPLSITKEPSNAQIMKIIIITGILSIMASIFVMFFLEYIERMKARENKCLTSK
jgi:hypothetical protein